MLIVKDKVKVEDGILHMKLPDEFKDKIVEVVVKIEMDIEEKLLIDKINIDTTSWKFDRDEIYKK